MVSSMQYPALFNETPSLEPAVDLKGNGEVSRMRSHKGNMPSLPQTKYCSLCPAKFTRTTHLNRHLRSHTNERLHHCNACSSQFTRSDLLTRHKRTCGDSMNTNRSRRKSCQSCAESKVKCDLQFPCSKCSARGRQCIFINDPKKSRIKKFAASQKHSHQPDGPKSANSSLPNDFPSVSDPTHIFASRASSLPSTYSAPEVPFVGLSPMTGLAHATSVDSSSFEFSNSSRTSSRCPSFDFPISPGSSSSSSTDESPRSDIFDTNANPLFPVYLDSDPFAVNSQFTQPFSDDILDPFFGQVLPSCAPDNGFSTATTRQVPLWADTHDIPDELTGQHIFPHSQPYDDPTTSAIFEPAANLAYNTSPTSFAPALEDFQWNFANLATPISDHLSLINSRQCAAAELQHYRKPFDSFGMGLGVVDHGSAWHIRVP